MHNRPQRAWLTSTGHSPHYLVWCPRSGQLHHLTYIRIGREDNEDLVPPCAPDHRKLHRVLEHSQGWRHLTRQQASVQIIALLRHPCATSRSSGQERAAHLGGRPGPPVLPRRPSDPSCREKHTGMVEGLLALRDHKRACLAQSAARTPAVDRLRALQDVTHFLRELNATTSAPATSINDSNCELPLSRGPGNHPVLVEQSRKTTSTH